MSSIKNNLGLQNSIPVKDKKASGIAKLMTEVNQHKDQKLTIEILCYWHKILLEHNSKINAGVWRAGVDPVQVVSGAYGSEEVQYEAPPSNRVPMEMEQFFKWYHQPELRRSSKFRNSRTIYEQHLQERYGLVTINH